MARTIYFNDGTHEILFGRNASMDKDRFARILAERLGQDCEQFFNELTNDSEIEELARRAQESQDAAESTGQENEELRERIETLERQAAARESGMSDARDAAGRIADAILSGEEIILESMLSELESIRASLKNI